MTSLRQHISSRAAAAAEGDPRVEFLLHLLDEYVLLDSETARHVSSA
jgi:hypothetical protein